MQFCDTVIKYVQPKFKFNILNSNYKIDAVRLDSYNGGDDVDEYFL